MFDIAIKVMSPTGVISTGNAWKHRSHCWKAAGTNRHGIPTNSDYGRHCESLSGQKCTRLQDFAYIQSQNFCGADIPGLPQKRLRCLDPDTNFSFACQRSHFSCFTKRPQVSKPTCSRSRCGDGRRWRRTICDLVETASGSSRRSRCRRNPPAPEMPRPSPGAQQGRLPLREVLLPSMTTSLLRQRGNLTTT